MPVFEGNKLMEGSRSHTGGLIVSGHVAPAQTWLLDQRFSDTDMQGVFNNGYLFDYAPGGYVNQKVVIPMGRVLGVTTPQMDRITGKLLPVVTLPGISNNNNAVGILPFNLYVDGTQQEKLSGNYATVVTNNYIKVPMMSGIKPATMDKAGLLKEEKEISIDMKMPWGAAIGEELLREGDYVKYTASGRFTKWDKSKDGITDLIGQVLATDYNFEESGWFKWMLYDQSLLSDKRYTGDDRVINNTGTSDIPILNDGYPITEKYLEGDMNLRQYWSEFIDNPTGMPGLHDGSGDFVGYGINDTEFKDIPQDTIPGTVEDGDTLIINVVGHIGEKITNLQNGLVLKVDGTEVDPSKYTVDTVNGKITLKVNQADAGKPITATFKAYRYGTSTYLDFKGVNGAVYILLKF